MPPAEGAQLGRRHAVLVAVLVVAGVLAGVVASVWSPRVYESQTQLFLSAPRAANAGGVHERALFAQQRVTSYLPLVNSPLVLSPVIRRLDLDTTPDRLARDVTASSPPDTVLMVVQVRQPTARAAQRIADATAEQLAAVVSGLEGEPGAPSSVDLSVVRPAQLDTSPLSPRPLRNALMGAGGGLLLGLGLAAVREKLDPRVVTRADVERLARTAVLAGIADDRKARRQPLVHRRRASAQADGFRRLRARLQLEALDGYTLLVTSPAHKDGRTTTALNLAIVLAEAGTSVIVLDCDRVRPAVHRYVDVPLGPGLHEVVEQRVPLDRVLADGPGGIQVVPNGVPTEQALAQRLLRSAELAALVDQARRHADVVLLDCPAVLDSPDALELVWLADAVLLVVRQGTIAPQELEDTVAALDGVEAVVLGAVLNRVRPRPRTAPRGMPLAAPPPRASAVPISKRAAARSATPTRLARRGDAAH